MQDFVLNKRLEQDSFLVTDLSLSQVRLINNQDYIWFILIPKINQITHLIDLLPEQQITLFQEISLVSKILSKLYAPDRLNIASLGNVVSQMHWHIIVRYVQDKTWPNPVWGNPFVSYNNERKNKVISDFLNELITYEPL